MDTSPFTGEAEAEIIKTVRLLNILWNNCLDNECSEDDYMVSLQEYVAYKINTVRPLTLRLQRALLDQGMTTKEARFIRDDSVGSFVFRVRDKEIYDVGPNYRTT